MSNPPSNDLASNDIPPAQRQPTEISFAEIEKASRLPVKPTQRRRGPLLGLLIVAGLAGVAVSQWDNLSAQVFAMREALASTRSQRPVDPTAEPSGLSTAAPVEVPTEAIAGVPAAGASTASEGAVGTGAVGSEKVGTDAAAPGDRAETLLNHRRYDEAPPESLVLLSPNSEVKLQSAAQASVNAMIAKAQAEGIQLGVASGFRSIEEQNYLYFEVKAERGQSAKTRAAVSAPPGYSEHHTGYAVDLMDESRPQTHLEESFETTPAYQWLQKNAAFFNFEMSFPKNNESNVAYEPWHWRYVGDQDSLETFYKD